MHIVYNLDPNPDKENQSKRIECPVCGQAIFQDPDVKFDCSKCGSNIYLDNHFKTRLLENKVPESKPNLIWAIILFFIASIAFFILFARLSLSLVQIGVYFTIMPVLIVAVLVYFYYEDGFQQIGDLYKALVKRRLKHYDFGSIMLITIVNGIVFVGIVMIILGIIIKV